MKEQTHPLYQALGQPHQILGCDRELFLFSLLLTVVSLVLCHDMVVMSCTLACAALVFFVLRSMGQRDLLLRHVFLRQLRYRKYYSAQARLQTLTHKHY